MVIVIPNGKPIVIHRMDIRRFNAIKLFVKTSEVLYCYIVNIDRYQLAIS
jgi:hypothetical protein